MKPTNKFNETVKAAAPAKKNSSQENSKQEQLPLKSSQENRDVVLSKISHIIEQAFNDTGVNQNS